MKQNPPAVSSHSLESQSLGSFSCRLGHPAGGSGEVPWPQGTSSVLVTLLPLAHGPGSLLPHLLHSLHSCVFFTPTDQVQIVCEL